jgi:hypothetical protein
MKQSDFKDFYATIQRFLLFLSAFWKFVNSLVHPEKPNPIPKLKSVKHIQIEYSEKYKTRFIESFNDVVTEWDSNVDDIVNDKEKLAELLEDKTNYLEKKWRSNILIENTPRGNVIMFYDIYKNAFSYYCDQSIVPYDVANAVAMKYVMTFRCRSFFVDSNILPAVKEDPVPTTNTPEQPIKQLEKDKDAPFAKFKSYNNATKKTKNSSTEKDKRINSFLHLGGTRNWCPIIKKTKANPINGFKTDLFPGEKKLSYLDYKKTKSISSAK